MPLADLFSDEGVVNFAVNNLDRAAFQSDHWTFLHIPKTAGSSFREEIANALQPDYNVEVDYHDLDPANTSGDFTGKMHTALSTYINQGFFKDTKFASGHFTYRELAQFEEYFHVARANCTPSIRLYFPYFSGTSALGVRNSTLPKFQELYRAPG